MVPNDKVVSQYLVFKGCDANKYLTQEERIELRRVLGVVQSSLVQDGQLPLYGKFVESSHPSYNLIVGLCSKEGQHVPQLATDGRIEPTLTLFDEGFCDKPSQVVGTYKDRHGDGKVKPLASNRMFKRLKEETKLFNEVEGRYITFATRRNAVLHPSDLDILKGMYARIEYAYDLSEPDDLMHT